MSYPANLDTIKVRHKIVDTGGKPMKGNSVRAVATRRIWATDGSLIPFETTARVAADGTYEFELPYVDQDGIHNKGVPFQVTEDVPGSPRHYFIAPVLAHGAGPIDATEALVEAPVGYEVKIQAGPVTDETAASLLDQDGAFKAALTGTYATHERLTEVATGQEAALTDSAVTGAITAPGSTARAAVQAASSATIADVLPGHLNVEVPPIVAAEAATRVPPLVADELDDQLPPLVGPLVQTEAAARVPGLVASETATRVPPLVASEAATRVPPLVASAIAADPTARDAAVAAIADATVRDEAIGRVAWFRERIGTPTGRDYNNMLTSGFYEILTGSIANAPTTAIGTLEVFNLNNGVGAVQRYTTWEATPRVFFRRYASSAWTPWVLEPNRTEVATLTGRVTAVETAISDALTPWRQTLATAGTAPAQILVVGDSISEGTGTTVLSRRWQTVLQGHLRRKYGHLAGATWPHIPARYNVTGTTGQPVTETGTNTFGYAWGLGWRTVRLETDDAALTFTFTGTSAKVQYVQLTTTGLMSVSVDGAAPVLVNTNGATDNAATWSTGPLSRGQHTVTIRRDPSSAAGQHVYVEGVLTYDGDETKGIRVVDASKHGISSDQFTLAAANQASDAVKAAGPFGLAIIAVGTNDYSASVTPATYRANVERLIAALRAPTRAAFTGSIVLLNVYKAGGREEALWQQYGDTLAAIAAADPLISYLDLRTSMPDVPTPATAPAGLSMYADALHPSDQGHQWIAGRVFDHITA